VSRVPSADEAPVPRLHVVTDDAVLLRADWSRSARAVLSAGGARLALHLRGPGVSGRLLHERTAELVEHARSTGACLIVNDRVDIAMTLPVWGVQLGSRSLPIAEARPLLAPGVRIGASVHGVAGALAAGEAGADYLVLGTVFATPSHPGRPGEGPALVAETRAATPLPLIAIGGMTPERGRALRAAGAHGVAVLSGVWDAEDPAGAVDAYLEGLGI